MASTYYSGCTAYVVVDSSVRAVVSVDVSVEPDHSYLLELGNKFPVAHVFGLQKIEGSITFAWGSADDSFFESWYNNQTAYTMDIYVDGTGTGSGGGSKYIRASSVVLTSYSPSNVEAGSSDGIKIEASFKALGYDISNYSS